MQHSYSLRRTLSIWRCLPAAAVLSCTCATDLNTSSTPNLRVYSRQDVVEFLRASGVPDFSLSEMRRNGRGSTLFLLDHYGRKREVLAVHDEGRIQVIRAPGDIFYLSDDGTPIAWTDDLKGGLSFRNGYLLPLVQGKLSVDPSGRYFLAQVEPNIMEIRSTARPELRLGLASAEAVRIFASSDAVYVFSRGSRKGSEPGNDTAWSIACQVFNVANGEVRLIQELSIPIGGPGVAVDDFDPGTGQVLLVAAQDPPFSFLTTWLAFDLKTKTLTSVGRTHGRYAFFMASDPLGNRAMGAGARSGSSRR